MQLQITDLHKTYGNGTKALNGVNLTIDKGMFGLLGPNGAGKSSLMRTIATLQEADQGNITLGSINVLKDKQEVRKNLGYLPQEFGLYPGVSATTMLDHLASLKGIANKKERKEVCDTLLQQVNLWSHKDKNLGGYSGGMKQRFGIAQALLGDPKLIIVDEPTAGLDPAERNRFHNLLAEIGENVIVILSTHIVEDVSDLCPQMAIINKGEVLLTGSPLTAIEETKGRIWKKTIGKDELAQYETEYKVISTRLFVGRRIINVYSETQPDPSFEPVEAHLEDVYFATLN